MIRRLDDVFYPIPADWTVEHLPVGDGHQVYLEQTGAADGVPLLSIPGGPGGGVAREVAALVDCDAWRLIQFEQRGCGRSLPKGALDNNSLEHTLRDIETVRVHLGIDRWAVAGGSWGSTVAIAYAEAYPERCLGLVAASVWLVRQQELDWWYYGVRAVFPDIWEQYAGQIPEAERGDLLKAYCDRILGDDPAVAEAAALAQYVYEASLMYVEAPMAMSTANALNYSRIYSHYARNRFFVRENQLIEDAGRLAGMPVVVVGARYDMCTPFAGAYDFARAVPHAELIIAAGGGHMPTERNTALAMSRGAQRLGELIRARG